MQREADGAAPMRLLVTCRGVTAEKLAGPDSLVVTLYPAQAACRLCNSRTGALATPGQTCEEAGIADRDMLFCMQHNARRSGCSIFLSS